MKKKLDVKDLEQYKDMTVQQLMEQLSLDKTTDKQNQIELKKAREDYWNGVLEQKYFKIQFSLNLFTKLTETKYIKILDLNLNSIVISMSSSKREFSFKINHQRIPEQWFDVSHLYDMKCSKDMLPSSKDEFETAMLMDYKGYILDVVKSN